MSAAVRITPVAPVATADLERYRSDLLGYCAWRLGSVSDADDAVQETMIRAWRGRRTFQGRASVRSWLYRIATNVCHDSLGSRARLPRPADLGTTEGAAFTIVDVLPAPDPAEVAAEHQAVRDAFTTAVRHLPPRQRAVLVLRDVLRWRAAEVAALLATTVASVNSALQRARRTLREVDVDTPPAPYALLDPRDAVLLEQYVAAFATYDVDTLVDLLRADALTPARR